MRTLAGVWALGVVMMLSAGCYFYSAPVMPPVGVIYSDYKAPLTVQLQGQTVTQQKGQAGSSSILGLIAWGDCSLQSAAKDGNLSTINYADYSYLNVIFGVYQKFTVTVYGK
jgi:hypothetical protein